MTLVNIGDPQAARILIVGGGAAGLSCAWELARNGLKVDIVDRGESGRGAVWASAGMLASGFETCVELNADHPLAGAFAALAAHSASLWPEWARRLEAESGVDMAYRRAGSITPVYDPSDSARIDAALEQARRFAVEIERLDGEGAIRCEPALARPSRALFFPLDGQVDNRAFARGLLSALHRTGTRFHERAPAEELIFKHGRVAGVRLADGRALEADAVIVATGAAALGALAVEAIDIAPVKGQMIAFEAPPGVELRRVVRGLNIYLAARANARIIAGATSEPGLDDVETRPEDVTALAARARAVMPALKNAPVADRWAGLRPAAPDHMPVAGASSAPGLFYALGGYRNGVLLAPAMARALRAAILDDAIPEIASPFGADRFAPRRQG